MIQKIILGLIVFGIFFAGCINQGEEHVPIVHAYCDKVSENFTVQDNKIVSSTGSQCEFSLGNPGAPSYADVGKENDPKTVALITPDKILVADRDCIQSIGFPTNYNEIIIDKNQNLYTCGYLGGA